MFEQAAVGMAILDAQGQICQQNQTLSQILGHQLNFGCPGTDLSAKSDPKPDFRASVAPTPI
ncbi:PAS domain-containing protein [Sodalinema gerasimenkoae]|uniref:PAS domain-containing protein n=1 Tax=Sodalinema gerasimenkoae TaxID=2862348 RepID=UPI003CCE133C